MDLYIFQAATTSRAVLAFFEAEGIPVTIRNVDLMKGEQHQAPLSDLNPNRKVPVLVDDGFVLTEASAILRYMAGKTQSRLYPTDLRKRARVDEAIAWFEANLYRDFGYQYVYPQLLPDHMRSPDAVNRATIEWGAKQSQKWLTVLNHHFLRHGERFFLGGELTIADFFGASILSLGELVGCSFHPYPNVERWYAAVTGLDSWQKIDVAFRGFASSLRGQTFIPLGAASG